MAANTIVVPHFGQGAVVAAGFGAELEVSGIIAAPVPKVDNKS
jgi:hypothetical protein